MKTIRKEFWVSDDFVSKNIISSDGSATVIMSFKNGHYKNKVTIEFESPEKKIELTESKLDSLKGEWFIYDNLHNTTNYHDFLKQKLFGDM